MANIESNTGLYIPSSEEKGKGDCAVFEKGNVLFGKLRPYLNKVYLAEFNGGCTTEFVVLNSINDEVISNRFLSVFLLLDCIVKQTKYMMTGNTLPRLQTYDIENLLIPVPKIDIQENVIFLMKNAYEKKKDREEEAQKLLAGIDEYLLNKLGISFPDEPENTIENRTFEVGFNDIFNNRLDAPIYSSNFSLDTEKFDMVNLKEYVKIDPYTKLPLDKKDVEVTFVPMEKISDIFGEADTTYSKYAIESRGYTRFQNGDLLWSKITPCMENGKSAVVYDLLNDIGFGSTEYYVFRLYKKINIYYIHALFRLEKFRKNAKLYFTGSSGHQRVSKDYFLKLKIPYPPITIQNEIVQEVKRRQRRAKKLQCLGIAILDKAKKEVEKIILGEDNES